MSFFSGGVFFATLAVVLIPAAFIGIFQSKYLRLYRYFASALFIWLIYGSDMKQLCFLLGYAVLSLYLSQLFLFLKSKDRTNPFLFHTFIALEIAPLCIYKITASIGDGVLGFLGISYICFRVVQVIIEIHDGLIKTIAPSSYLGFLLFFPSLSSGPIDRSRRFDQDEARTYTREEYIVLAERGLLKLVCGAFYKLVCSEICHDWMTTWFPDPYVGWSIPGRIYLYGLYLFFDFAGYSMMAVGTAYILGVRLPDNFNKPFISLDMKDFWNRWHITLSTWFRDFIFNRFMMNTLRKKTFKNRLSAASAGFIINMLVMGMWHGLEAHYIEYGLYHGIILALTEIYQKKSGFYKRNRNKLWYKVCAWFVTLNIVMLGFGIFSGYVNEMVSLWMKGANLNLMLS